MKNAITLFLFTFLIFILFLPSFTKKQELSRRNRKLQEQIEALKAENTKLAEEKRLLTEDPVYLEKVAREKMGIVREGEMVYRLFPQEEEEK